MEIISHTLNGVNIAEIVSEELILNNIENGIDLVGNLYYQNFDGCILQYRHITPDFFNLKSGLAGEILQKFSNYKLKLAIIGDFNNLTSHSLRDFIYESNQGKQIIFVHSLEEALKVISIHGKIK